MKYIEAIMKSLVALVASVIPAIMIGMATNSSEAVYSVLVFGAIVSVFIGINHVKEYE